LPFCIFFFQRQQPCLHPHPPNEPGPHPQAKKRKIRVTKRAGSMEMLSRCKPIFTAATERA